MLRILNSAGRQLDLVKQVITTDKFNPLFNDPDKLVQDISYAFNAPLTENNKLFFGLAHLIESSNSSFLLKDVRFFAEESLIISGNIRFRVNPDNFECNLEPNLTALNYMLKNIYLNDIRTQDSDFTSANTEAKFKALMLDTCKFPDKYNYIFMPVEHPSFGAENIPTYGWINYFSVNDQEFKVSAPSSPFRIANTPFFKLTYILKVIARYLDMQPVGDFFDNQDNNRLYIFNSMVFNGGIILPCMKYMPKMLIVDFLKVIRERLHLAYDFNLSNRTLTVKTLADVNRSTRSVDITPYLVADVEQELPTEKGFKVSLKSDTTDKQLEATVNGETGYPPVYTLIMGQSTTEVELECSTLRSITENSGYQHLKTEAPIFNPVNYGDPLQEWPIRLMRYVGYNQHNGKYTPDSTSVELDDKDLFYYRFQNDSKRITLSALLPPSFLASMNLTDRYCYRSSGLNYVNMIIEKISYDSISDAKLIPTKIVARTMNFDELTKGSIVFNTAFAPPAQVGIPENLFTAYFDKDIHGFDKLSIDLVKAAGSGTAVYQIADITAPTNSKGSGGVAVTAFRLSGTGTGTLEVRIHVGKPRFIEQNGQRYPFTYNNGYYSVQIIAGWGILFDPWWISF